MEREFKLSISTDRRTGRLIAVYFQVRRGQATKVREFAGGNALANYDDEGDLLGIELLGPCSVSAVDKIAKKDKVVRQFVRQNAPRRMLVAN